MPAVPRPTLGGAAAGGDLLTAGPDAVFTKRASTATVDVLRFHLELVIDARRLLEVLDAISKAGFYTPLNVDMREVTLETNEYYIYGTAPVVHVTMLYEGCFLRSSCEKSMPQAIKDAIAQGRAGASARALGVARAATGGPGGPAARRWRQACDGLGLRRAASRRQDPPVRPCFLTAALK